MPNYMTCPKYFMRIVITANNSLFGVEFMPATFKLYDFHVNRLFEHSNGMKIKLSLFIALNIIGHFVKLHLLHHHKIESKEIQH